MWSISRHVVPEKCHGNIGSGRARRRTRCQLEIEFCNHCVTSYITNSAARHAPLDVLISTLTMIEIRSIVSDDGAPVMRVGEEMHYRWRRSEDRKGTHAGLVGCMTLAGLLFTRAES